MRRSPAVPLLLCALVAGCFATPETKDSPFTFTTYEAPAGEFMGPTDPDAPDPVAAPPVGGFSDNGMWAGTYDLGVGPSQPMKRGPHASIVVEVIGLQSSIDGANIELAVARPDSPDPVPVIVAASPYYQVLTADNIEAQYLDGPLVSRFVQHGYAVALVAVRGTGGSTGCPDFFGPNERSDLAQAIDWLAKQEWSSGSLGAIGLSYVGGTAWEAAAVGNPAMKTIVPMSGITDLHSLFFTDGVARNSGVILPALLGPGGMATYGTFQSHAQDGIACPGVAEGTALAAAGLPTGGIDPTGYFAARDLRSLVLANYNGSILLVSGLRDPRVPPDQHYPFADELASAGLTIKHLLGQWDHASPDDPAFPENNLRDARADRADWAEMLLHWFDYWLKGDLSADIGARASVQDTAFQWRTEATWPPTDAQPLQLHLASSALSMTPPTAAGTVPIGYDSNSHDDSLQGEGTIPPRDPAGLPCPQCATFTMQALPVDVRYAGIATVQLRVTPTSPGGQVSVHLYVQGDGESVLVGQGAIDVRYASGDAGSPVIPGMPIDVTIRLLPNDVIVPAGSTLVAQVAVGGYAEHLPGVFLTPMSLTTGPGTGILTLPFIARDGSTFFDPPAGA